MQNVWARYRRSCDRRRGDDSDTRTAKVALFAHGHALPVLVARRHGLFAGAGQHFLLDMSVLANCHYGIPAVKTSNAPLAGYVPATAERKTDVTERTTT